MSHPGFSKVASSIAKRGDYSMATARAILASKSRHASKAAVKRNPRLLRVKRSRMRQGS